MTQIIINGSVFNGNSISIKNGKITVDCKDVTPDQKEISISVTGDVKELKADSCNKITVKGNVTTVSTLSGDVEISGDVQGPVTTMSGDVKCGNIAGSVQTMSGDIRSK